MRKILCLLFLLLISIRSYAGNTGKYILEADTITGRDEEYFTAKGNVKVYFRNVTITADEATYYIKDDVVEATGNVTIKDDTQDFKAERVVYNLSTDSGNAENIKGIMGGIYYVCARNMTKEGKDVYVMEGLVITTCEGDNPDWSFEFYKATGEVEGYLVGDHATANIKNLPILYTPKLIYPLKTIRQTGFLIPSLGFDSKKGAYVSENFFYAVDYDKDITLGANFFTEKGVMGISELRHAVSNDSRIYLAADFIRDNDDDINVRDRWRYVSKSFINSDDFEFKLDVDHVSDYMFSRDYSKYSIYDKINAENHYNQYASLMYRSFAGDLQFYYGSNYKYKDTANGYTKTSVIQRPSISLEKYALMTPVANIDYRFIWDNVQYSKVSRDNSSKISTDRSKSYQRFHGNIKVYNNYNLIYARFEPYANIYYTRWTNWDSPLVKTGSSTSFAHLYRSGDGYERIIPNIGAKLNLNEIYRQYSHGKHGILTSIEYTYTPELDQTGLADHLDKDRISGTNNVSWIMNNYYRSDTWGFSLRLKQPFNFSVNETLEPLEIDFYLGTPYVRATNKTKLDYYNKKTGQTLLSMENNVYLHMDGNTFFVKYSYDSDQKIQYNTVLESGFLFSRNKFDITAGVIWKGKNDSVSFSGLSAMEARAGFLWKSQCWSSGVNLYTEKYTVNKSYGWKWERNYKLELYLELKGLGANNFNIYKGIKGYD